MRLTKSIRCPIHNSLTCCGRSPKQQMPRRTTFNRGIKRIDDPASERGYREIRTPAEMRKLLLVKVREQDGKCALCGEEFEDMHEVTADHKRIRGMGAAHLDSHPDNVQAVHGRCNCERGSKPL
jgi:hypothetical protein